MSVAFVLHVVLKYTLPLFEHVKYFNFLITNYNNLCINTFNFLSNKIFVYNTITITNTLLKLLR